MTLGGIGGNNRGHTASPRNLAPKPRGPPLNQGSERTKRVTDATIRNAKPQDKPYKVGVGGGLYCEVYPNGSKQWRLKYRLGGKENRFAMGAYPDMSMAQARIEAEEARKLVKAGIHPAQQRTLDRIQAASEQANSFKAVAREWVDLKDWEDVTKARRLSLLERTAYPAIERLPINQIKPAHILDILKRAHADNGPSVADELKRTLSGVFDLAISTLRAEINPVLPVMRALPANKTQHKRPLSPAEIGGFLRDLDGYSGHFQTTAALKLMWLTLCRPNEVAEAEWSEFDLEAGLWTIQEGRMKKRKEHTVTLPRQALAIVKAMHPLTGHRTHLFPHRDNHANPMTTATLRAAINALGWGGKYSPHATRTTGSTQLNGMGYSSDWIESQLAHADQNSVRRTYNHASYLEDRRRMMQAWADYLDGLREGGTVIVGKFGAGR